MSGNGIDLGAIHQILLGIAQVQREHGHQLAELRAQLRKEMNDVRSQIGGLRQQVTEYHSSVLGHGILISELDQRVRRLEEHLGLPPVA
jgi:hypothetical protein